MFFEYSHTPLARANGTRFIHFAFSNVLVVNFLYDRNIHGLDGFEVSYKNITLWIFSTVYNMFCG
jgi:hypothetical protein